MSELKAKSVTPDGPLNIYSKSDVDKVIAEKDKVIAKLKAACINTDNSSVIENMANELENLRPMETALELAEADNRGYLARIKELEAKNLRLERALYKACANWAKECRYKIGFAISSMNTKYDYSDADKWQNVERKCRAKAEEYK